MNGNERLKTEFAASGSCDCSYAIENVARFRVNIFKQNGRHALVMRKLESEVPTLEKLGLPPIFREIVKRRTGSFSSPAGQAPARRTTLAAMLNELNQNAGDSHRDAGRSDRVLSSARKGRDQPARAEQGFRKFRRVVCARPCARRPKPFWSARFATPRRSKLR